MVCSAFFGEISETRKKNWPGVEKNPSDILISPVSLDGKGHDLLDASSKYFTDEVKVDWGSYAWKCAPEQIILFLNDYKSSLPWLQNSEKNKIQEVKNYITKHGQTEYAVVFVENY